MGNRQPANLSRGSWSNRRESSDVNSNKVKEPNPGTELSGSDDTVICTPSDRNSSDVSGDYLNE